MLELILGGARCGKSRLAETRAASYARRCLYLATAQPGDSEMRARIAAHRARRGDGWRLVEEPLTLAAALQNHSEAGQCILVDCLTLWLSNLFLAQQQQEELLARETEALLQTLPRLPGHTILVSNEVGLGIVPANPTARRFRDNAGELHQRLAQCCDQVSLVVAGLPQPLKTASSIPRVSGAQ